MTVQTYRKKPVTIEAVQWTGNNVEELYGWAVRVAEGPINAIVECFRTFDDDGIYDAIREDKLYALVTKGCTAALWVDANSEWLGIVIGEWVAKDRHGFYPIKDDMFRESYDLT